MTSDCLDRHDCNAIFIPETAVIAGSIIREQAIRGIRRAIGNAERAITAAPGNPDHNGNNVTFPPDNASVNRNDGKCI